VQNWFNEKRNLRLVFSVVILATIPCYCSGLIVLALRPGSDINDNLPISANTATDTRTPTITLTPYLTRTPTITPTLTITPSLTDTTTPTHTLTVEPTITETPTKPIIIQATDFHYIP
jgi:hypothetical protein